MVPRKPILFLFLIFQTTFSLPNIEFPTIHQVEDRDCVAEVTALATAQTEIETTALQFNVTNEAFQKAQANLDRTNGRRQAAISLSKRLSGSLRAFLFYRLKVQEEIAELEADIAAFPQSNRVRVWTERLNEKRMQLTLNMELIKTFKADRISEGVKVKKIRGRLPRLKMIVKRASRQREIAETAFRFAVQAFINIETALKVCRSS